MNEPIEHQLDERILPNLHKVATTEELIALNKTAVEREYNRSVTDEFLRDLDPHGRHLCTMSLLHRHKAFEPCEPHVRGQWVCKMRNTTSSEDSKQVFIDMDASAYMALPEYDPETGDVAHRVTRPGWDSISPLEEPD